MAEAQPTGPGTFCWNELATHDVEAAKAFYSELVGWQMVDNEIGGQKYTMLIKPGADQPVGGMLAMEGPQWEGVPPHWMTYIHVEDVDASAARCEELGGQVRHPPTDIPDVGRFCVVSDPTGAVVSLFQSLQNAEG